MITNKISVLLQHGQQTLPDLDAVRLPKPFRGRPVIRAGIPTARVHELQARCPSGAIGTDPLSIDLGCCIFCGECQHWAPEFIDFTTDYRLSSTCREALIVREGADFPIPFHPERIRPLIPKLFRQALKLRQVSAGGDNSGEMELTACGNVNFDLGRFGIEFTASPRHADGVVITGPFTENMGVPLELCYNAVPDPKIVVLVGADAISGGLFTGTAALDRSFLGRHPVDLYVPGNPAHPLTFIDGLLTLIGRKEQRA